MEPHGYIYSVGPDGQLKKLHTGTNPTDLEKKVFY
jgi:hypothetical protein